MPQSQRYKLLHAMVTSTRSEAAQEVADVLVALFDEVDVAEETLQRVLQERPAYDRLFWDEVLQLMAQFQSRLRRGKGISPT